MICSYVRMTMNRKNSYSRILRMFPVQLMVGGGTQPWGVPLGPSASALLGPWQLVGGSMVPPWVLPHAALPPAEGALLHDS